MKKILLSFTMLLIAVSSQAALSFKGQGGWYESCWMEFTGLNSSYSHYNAYISDNGGNNWTLLDGELIRSYGTFGRVDALGLKAGNYLLKVVPVANNAEVMTDAVQTPSAIEVKQHDRSGFAHFNYSGVGAYNDDGTPKSNARIIYITSNTAKTVTLDVKTEDKYDATNFTGLQAIITAYQKGRETRPLIVRFIGTIEADDMDGFDSSSEGLQIKGKTKDSKLDMTFEGVGNDAFIHGFGFLVRNAASVEMRNFGVATLMDDGISLDTDNDHIWIHHMDVFYGPNKGGDQKKGDGAIDVKTNSKHVTIAYVHFWDTGKSTMCGMKSESGPNYITYHHNWFDHSDSRHARIRTMSVHMYNNYYDGIAKYGAGACTGSSVFMESNYFRNCTKPMLISMQGTDTKNGTDEKDAPTFSKEDGGIIKSYKNFFSGSYTLAKWSSSNTVHFDCYEASTRGEQVPESVTAKQGGTKYDNFDTNTSVMYQSYILDEAENVPNVVTDRTWGAGRMQGGDFIFTFTNADDADYEVNSALRNAIDNYKPSLVDIIGKEGGAGSGSTEPDDPSDTRAESSFTLTSESALTLDQNATSQISTSGAAGDITYVSNNTEIASVDNNGTITAVGPGKTMIIITDAGSETVKGAKLNVSVTVIGTVIADGDVMIQAGELPYGYAVDEETSFSQYTYSGSDWVNNANLFLADASQHKVTIPTGVKVTAVTLYAVNDNNTAGKGKITELAGKSFDISLPSRKSDKALATATVEDIDITNELTFTITYKSGVKLALKVASDATSIQEINNNFSSSNTKAVKRLKDGHLVIERDGKLYNVAGILVE
ncbi:MAG: Ig-like domain-containing protein [Prevotella sp.]|nr:Ig-like domain-containing protein [Prevotella sp.]